MFSNVLRSSLVALVASAAAVQAAATFNNCSAEQQTVLTNAAAAGQPLVVDSMDLISSVSPLTPGPLYTTWFGTWSAANEAQITDRFKVLFFGDISTYTYNCSPTTTGISPGNAFGTFEVGPDIVSASAPAIGTADSATHLWLSALVASVTDSFPQLKDQSSVTAADTKKFVIDNGAAAAVNNGPSYVFFMEEDTNF